MSDRSEVLTIFDLSDRAQIELRGADRQTFLNNFCTNDIKSLQPGQGCEAFLTSIKGRILGHLIVSAADESLWIDSVPGSNLAIASHLDKYLITEDVEIIDRTGERGPLCLVGAEAQAWLRQQTGLGELPVWGQQRGILGGIDVVVRRIAFTEPPAYELIVPHELRAELASTICGSGVASGSGELFEYLRIAAGFPHYGVDLTEDNIAQEAARNRQAISFTKGCYLGQEPIARLDALGHTNKELRRLQLEEQVVPPRGATVVSQTGADAGLVTSSAASPDRAGARALSMLKSAFTAAGTELDVVVGDERVVPAVVV